MNTNDFFRGNLYSRLFELYLSSKDDSKKPDKKEEPVIIGTSNSTGFPKNQEIDEIRLKFADQLSIERSNLKLSSSFQKSDEEVLVFYQLYLKELLDSIEICYSIWLSKGKKSYPAFNKRGDLPPRLRYHNFYESPLKLLLDLVRAPLPRFPIAPDKLSGQEIDFDWYKLIVLEILIFFDQFAIKIIEESANPRTLTKYDIVSFFIEFLKKDKKIIAQSEFRLIETMLLTFIKLRAPFSVTFCALNDGMIQIPLIVSNNSFKGLLYNLASLFLERTEAEIHVKGDILHNPSQGEFSSRINIDWPVLTFRDPEPLTNINLLSYISTV